MDIIKAQILKVLNGNMNAISDGIIFPCAPTGNVKKSKIFVGDFVELVKNEYGDKYIVERIYDRENILIRPPLANLQQLFILISKEPKTDFLLIDKLIIYCLSNGITPYIVINKQDLYTEEEINSIIDEYHSVVKDIIVVSAKLGVGIDKLRKNLTGKLSAFAGQSAVGKSTLLNSISPDLRLKTNILSKKTSRGKHTTRHSEIYLVGNNIMIADTPGFSLLDLDINNIQPEELQNYYLEFAKYRKCKYTNCDHTNINDDSCQIAKAVKIEEININRYNRYVKLYKLMKEKWRKKYD